MFKQFTLWCLVAAALGSVVFPNASAETGSPQLKAVYTLNFAKFTHWPDDYVQGDSLGVCYTDQASVAQGLANTSVTQIGDKSLRLRRINLPGNVSGCHVFFIHDQDPQRLRRYLATLRGLPILLVGDSQDFVDSGGMVELFELNRKIRFRINLGAIRQSGLRLDAQLLNLAVEVIR